MPLSLTTSDIKRLNALQETLLAPLEHARVEDWCLAVLRSAEALYHGDRSIFLVPLDGALHNLSESVDPRYLAAFARGIVRREAGAFHFAEPLTERAHTARRTKKIDVWNIPMLTRLGGVSMKASPVYHEVVKPAGITHGPVISTSLPGGEAYLGTTHSRAGVHRFEEDAELALASLVLPAFRAGVHIIERMGRQRAELLSALDSLDASVVICDVAGTVLYETRRAAALLTDDPEQYEVRAAMRAVAGSLVRLRYSHRLPDGAAVGSREVTTRQRRYVLSGSFAGRGVLGFDEAILVRIEAPDPRLPTAQQLVGRYGLTAREAEIALCLANGLSNMAIAAQLGISQHTVRHHSENVFLKLGIHSRKALALTLLDGRREGERG